jgi:hypothetical protein
MRFRLRRIRDLLAVEEGGWPHQHEGGGRREELKGARAWYEEQVPDVLYQLYGWGLLGGGVMMAEGSGTDHACTLRSPQVRGQMVANERLSKLAGDAVWQIRSIGRIWARWARPARGRLDVGG